MSTPTLARSGIGENSSGQAWRAQRACRRLLLMVIVVSLLAASCSNSEDELTTTGSVADALDLGEGETAFTNLSMRWEIVNQRLIQQCMIERGFEYTPRAIEVDDLFERQPGEGLSDLAFAQEWGLGIAPAIALQLTDPEVEPRNGSEEVNPNELHVSSLSDLEAQAWLEAFDGGFAGLTDDALFKNSCLFEAGSQSGASAIFAFQDDLDEVEARATQDDRFIAAEQVWSACMADQGFSFASELEMRDSFFDAVDEAIARDSADGEARAGPSEGLVAVAENERRTALAHVACLGDKEAVQNEIRNEYEAEYLASNGGLLQEVLQAGS